MFLLWFWIFYNPLCWILLYPKSECWISQVYLQPFLSFSFVSLDSLICLHEFNFYIYEDHFQVPVSRLLPSEFKILFIYITSVLGCLKYIKSNILKTQLMIFSQYFLPQSTVGLSAQLLIQEGWNPFLGNCLTPHIHETTKFSEFELLIFFFFLVLNFSPSPLALSSLVQKLMSPLSSTPWLSPKCFPQNHTLISFQYIFPKKSQNDLFKNANLILLHFGLKLCGVFLCSYNKATKSFQSPSGPCIT